MVCGAHIKAHTKAHSLPGTDNVRGEIFRTIFEVIYFVYKLIRFISK